MTTFESDKVIVNRSSKDVFGFLEKPESYKTLMPSSVEKFELDGDTVHLNIKGLGNLSLAITEKNPFSTLKIIPVSNPPFDFHILWQLEPAADNKTLVKATMEANLNMMMKMMVQGFLKEFVNKQVFKLKREMEENESGS